MRRIAWPVVLLSLTVMSFTQCSEEPFKLPNSWPDGFQSPDSYVAADVATGADMGALPDGLAVNKNGPIITMVSPTEGAIVIGNTLTVQAKITDKDLVDAQKVNVTIQGQSKPTPMTFTANDEYEAKIDVSKINGKSRLWVEAADRIGNSNSLVVNFTRVPGPSVTFINPKSNARVQGKLSIHVVVADKYKITDFSVSVGSQKVQMAQKGSGTTNQEWIGEIKFADFSPPLSGKQALTAKATNEHKAVTTKDQPFFVDDQGPTIKILSHKPGAMIGGIIEISASISDDTGVVGSTAVAVVGNGLVNQVVPMKPTTVGGNTYMGKFDTRNLKQTYLWPVISVRASDKLANESHEDIQVGLDNGQPILELDPPEDFYIGKKKNAVIECSKPFDPVGPDAISDKQQVPQIIKVRARIEDQGNYVPSAPWIPIAALDKNSVKLYVLDDTTKALVVDTNGDGYCDAINPDIIPSGSAPKQGEAVAVKLTPISKKGGPDYSYTGTKSPPTPCTNWGTESTPPGPLCTTTTATTTLKYAGTQLSIYTIPPVSSGAMCMGLPFDFFANKISEKWACLAVVAKDTMGNMGITPPLRVYVNLKHTFTAPTDYTSSLGTPPHCTGTKVGGKVDSTKPCIFNNPRKGSDPTKGVYVCKAPTQNPRPQQYCHQEVVVE